METTTDLELLAELRTYATLYDEMQERSKRLAERKLMRTVFEMPDGSIREFSEGLYSTKPADVLTLTVLKEDT